VVERCSGQILGGLLRRNDDEIDHVDEEVGHIAFDDPLKQAAVALATVVSNTLEVTSKPLKSETCRPKIS
jgi:hypothetical protein